MNLPTSEPLNPPEEQLPPARRRRQRRQVLPGQNDDYAMRLDDMGQRTTPGVEFFLSALLSGMLFGIALLIDSPALAILSVLLAPFTGPVVGLALASAAGSPIFFLRMLVSLVAGGLIYFLTGTLAGWLALLLPPGGIIQTAAHLLLTWPDMLLLVIGMILTTYLLVRAPLQRPIVSSIAVAYAIFLPLGAAGFALTSGSGLNWLDGLGVFAAHLVIAMLSGVITFAFVGLRPRNLLGYAFVLLYLLVCAGAILPLTGAQFKLPEFALPSMPTFPVLAANASPTQTARADKATPKPAGADTKPLPTPSLTAAAPSPTGETAAQVPPSATPSAPPEATPTQTPTRTLVPSPTHTQTVTPMPTPVWARINAKDGNGAYIRAEPSYDANYVKSLLNGYLIQVLPDVVIKDGATWVKVRTAEGIEGWIVRSLLATATPAPGW